MEEVWDRRIPLRRRSQVRSNCPSSSTRAVEASRSPLELESVPESKKGWRPRSNNVVLDLGHPFLYPLILRPLSSKKLDLRIGISISVVGEVIPSSRSWKTRKDAEMWNRLLLACSSGFFSTLTSPENSRQLSRRFMLEQLMLVLVPKYPVQHLALI
jgi:hypothetical protein